MRRINGGSGQVRHEICLGRNWLGWTPLRTSRRSTSPQPLLSLGTPIVWRSRPRQTTYGIQLCHCKAQNSTLHLCHHLLSPAHAHLPLTSSRPDEIAASMRGYVAWFASLFSAVLALTKLAFIADWRKTAYDERLLHGLEASNASQLEGTRIPSILFIVMTTLQLVNATLLWYRNDRIYLRCAGLIAMDAIIVSLAGICFHLSVPFLFEGRKGEQEADSYKGGVVPPPEGHVIHHPELRNGAGTVFGMSLGDLGLHLIVVLLWVKCIPSHDRLSNMHRPMSLNRNGTRGKGVKGCPRQSGRNTSGLELAQPVQRDLTPLDRLFQDHEKTWRAGRMAGSGYKASCDLPQNRKLEDVLLTYEW